MKHLLRRALIKLEQPWRRAVIRLSTGGGGRPRAMYYAHRSREFVARQDWIGATLWGEVAVRSDPGWSEGYAVLGAAYRGAGDIAKAREILHQGAGLDPQNPWFPEVLGDLEFDAKQWADSETWYREALQLRPDDARMSMRLAMSLEEQGRWDEATAFLEGARHLAPTDGYMSCLLGEARLRQGDLQGAEAVLREAVAQEPELRPAHYYLATTLAETGNWDHAKAEARRVLELNPNDELANELLATIERKSRQAGEQA